MKYLGRVWLPILLFCVALLPRLVFPSHITVIADMERDYSLAARVLRDGQVPLLGIPSSVPRFSQGPVNIWFAALSFVLGGVNPISPVLLSGLFVSLGVVLFYGLLRRFISTQAATAASLLWAASLAGITQSRMPFYLFAEPVFLIVYLYGLEKLSLRIKSVALATLAFFLLFQWELATIPLVGLLLVKLWRLRIPLSRAVIGLAAGGCVGLLPQIIFDLQHHCQQLCGFGIWMGYRLTAVSGFDGRHGYSFTKFVDLIVSIAVQLKALLGWGNWWLLALVLGLACLSLGLIKKNNPLLTSAWSGVGLLMFGLFIHGQPSEAYFPPFLILIPVVFAFGFNRLKQIWQNVLLLLFIIVACVSVWNLATSWSFRDPISRWELRSP